MRALYDTGEWLTSFNFFEWLVQAKTLGATVVVFDIRRLRGNKWPRDIAKERFRSICVPGAALAGLPYEVFGSGDRGDTNARNVARANGGALLAFWREHGGFERLRSPKPPGTERYTVTLRKTQRSPLRNSDESVWRNFATEIGARIIPDYEDEPIHLHDRMALYAGAEMNFFVSNGPGLLCSFTEYPCMLFNTHHSAGSLEADGLKGWGAQHPWLLPNQRAIWEEATSESIRRHFYHWKETGEFFPPPSGSPAA